MLGKKNYLKLIDKEKLPYHIGIIMDGNGRWAKSRGLARSFGHKEGAKTFDRIVDTAGKIGIKVLTFYAFSTENWSRPKDEVDFLMSLLKEYIEKAGEKLSGKDTRVLIIGERDNLSPEIIEGIEKVEKETKDGKSLTVRIALNYGGRREIACAAKKAAQMAKEGKIKISDIDEEYLSSLMYGPTVSDPDLIIRPGGEMRISNFLLWGSAYSELYFTDKLWPSFSDNDFYEAVYRYQLRKRRFGKV